MRTTKLCFCISLIASLTPAVAQEAINLYYNKDWILTSKDSAVFVRKGMIDTEGWPCFDGKVEDFTKEGKLIMTGGYAEGKKNGPFAGYDTTGRKLWEGSYNDDKRVGEWNYYYADGSLKSSMRFVDSELEVITYLDSTGKVLVENGTGSWTAEYKEFQGEHIVVRGKFKNYKHDDIWTWSLKNGKLWSKAKFREGRFVDAVIEVEGQLVKLANAISDFPEDPKHEATEGFYLKDPQLLDNYYFVDKIKGRATSNFSVSEVNASPVGGMMEFYQEVSRLLNGRYPQNARRRGIQGNVFVEFVVGKDGTLTDFKVIKGIGGGCDEVAASVVSESQERVKWRPGIQQRKFVKMKYTLPVIFKLG